MADTPAKRITSAWEEIVEMAESGDAKAVVLALENVTESLDAATKAIYEVTRTLNSRR